ncbi:MAG: nicotinate phosphoribosyltransferase, partial [Psychrosphaera sp.]|nr:nicotinate phosphoribosyltransferase [Psychrosphaera sp.]
EHSTMTSWGKDHETEAYANMLKQFAGPGKLVAVVSDSYDLFHAIDTIWGETLIDDVKNCGGTVVVRPDSGEPVEIVLKTLEHLMNKFGHTVNSKGYRILPDCIRVIQGDGVSRHAIEEILEAMKQNKLSADNVAFGMGGELLQKLNRDTMKFAMKASAVKVNGQWRDVFKDPVTDHGKRSKKGRLAVIKDTAGVFQTIAEKALGEQQNCLQTVFKNGELLIETSFDEVRARATVLQ